MLVVKRINTCKRVSLYEIDPDNSKHAKLFKMKSEVNYPKRPYNLYEAKIHHNNYLFVY